MIFGDFLHKLQKLNRDLWVDTYHRASIGHPHFKFSGLYLGQKHVMAITLNNINEYSIMAVKSLGSSNLIGTDAFVDIDTIYKTNQNVQTKLVARGYPAILKYLVSKKHISKRKAEKVFNCKLTEDFEKKHTRYLDFQFAET